MKGIIAARYWIVVAWIAALWVLHPNSSLWITKYLLFVFMPFGLAFGLACHVGITALVVIAVIVFVREQDSRDKLLRCVAVAWIADLLVMHQDSWLWTDKTLLFGCVPIGLAYHAGFTVVAAITLFVFTRTIWPKHLEEEEQRLPPADQSSKGAH